MKRVLLLCIVMLLSSQCAWFSSKLGFGVRDSDLVETFDLQDEKFAQYKISPKRVEMPPEEDDEIIIAAKNKNKLAAIDTRENKKRKSQKAAIAPKSRPPTPVKKRSKKVEKLKTSKKAEVKAIPSEKDTPAKVVATKYPEDYPSIYQKYDQTSAAIWSKYRSSIYVGEKIVIRLSSLGVKAGTVSMVVRPNEKIAGQTAYYLSARLKSAKFYSYIYKLDDSLHTFVDSSHFLPIKYSLTQRESGQSVDDLQLFDRKELKTHFWYKRIKNKKTKEEKKSAYIPRYALDSFSALYFIRGLPLKDGDSYQIPIVTRAKIWLMKVKVEKRELIEVNGQNYRSIRINAVTHYPGVLKRRGNITFWFADNNYRDFLKFRAKIKIGSVHGERITLYR